MTAFVDDARNPFGRYLMCHMWTDTREELLAMVDRISVQRKWIQEPPKTSWLHFDVTQSKRVLAVKAGAIQTDRYGPVEFLARRNGDQTTLHQVARCRALKEPAYWRDLFTPCPLTRSAPICAATTADVIAVAISPCAFSRSRVAVFRRGILTP